MLRDLSIHGRRHDDLAEQGGRRSSRSILAREMSGPALETIPALAMKRMAGSLGVMASRSNSPGPASR